MHGVPWGWQVLVLKSYLRILHVLTFASATRPRVYTVLHCLQQCAASRGAISGSGSKVYHGLVQHRVSSDMGSAAVAQCGVVSEIWEQLRSPDQRDSLRYEIMSLYEPLASPSTIASFPCQISSAPASLQQGRRETT